MALAWIATAPLVGCSESTSSKSDGGEGGNAQSAASTGGSADADVGGRGGMPVASGSRDASGGKADAAEAGPKGDGYPAEILDLANWKLTLPIAGQSSTSPLEITQPELATYRIDPWFRRDPAGGGVLFRANAAGVTTSNSGYPRSELREMTGGGAVNASWSTTSGTHTLLIEEAVTHLPVEKPHVVAGQIHDASDDVVMIRLENDNLFVEGGGTDLGGLDAAYAIGTPFTVKIVASGGHIQVFYNDMNVPKVDVARSNTGCYFKAGAYTQSNTSKGDAADAYGEVIIRNLQVTHR